MKTYRGGTGWTTSAWPTSPGMADITQWNFQEATGLLSSKVSAFGTADAKTVSYTYTATGQMKTRQWARILTGTTPVTTTYSYFGEGSGEPLTGELRKVDYNDSTTDLEYTYNRLGQQDTVTDTTGSRTLNYALGTTLELQSEDLPAYYGSRRVTYPRATTGVIGRPAGLQLGTSGTPTADQSVSYGYATDGRFNSLTADGTAFTYAYTTNSNLIASITQSGANWTQSRIYLTNRDLLDVIESKISTTSKAKFDYAQDDLGRFTSVAKTGELFDRYGDGTEGLKTSYGYDDRSQVTSEVTEVGTSGTVLTGRNDAYAYDLAGNRASTAGTTHNGTTAAYTTNALNQYTQRTTSGIFDVAGSAGTGTTVTVSKSGGPTHTATRHGQYFFDGYGLTNTSLPVFATLVVSDGTNTFNLPAFVAKTPEPFTYDDDGNLTRDGRWDYTYDAENRLVAMETISAAYTAGAPRQKLQFTNDYLGRRVGKLVSNWDSGSASWLPALSRKFIYDGWNLMAEFDALSSLTLLRTFAWGPDWSGTLQGAGGVGGLLQIKEGSTTYFPMFDGNGNVHGLIKASDGSLAAAYEYDAFGNTLRESGTYAASNPFRFSTKYTDIETGLVYYGLRYYSPTLGRFINRDPISEQGGLNLYGFCGNNGVNRWDYLGNISQDYYYQNNASNPDLWYQSGMVYDGDPIIYLYGTSESDPSKQGLNAMDRAREQNAAMARQAFAKSLLNDAVSNVSAASGIMSGENLGAINSSWGASGTSLVSDAPNTAGTPAASSSSGGSVLGSIVSGALGLVGKVWNLPNTVIGVTAGLVGWALGGDAPTISNNAIVFANNPLASAGAITLGNAILIGAPTKDNPDWGPNYVLPNGYTVLQHEEQHTYQGQLLGPLYLPANGVAAAISVATAPPGTYDKWHYNNFMENGPQSSPPAPWP